MPRESTFRGPAHGVLTASVLAASFGLAARLDAQAPPGDWEAENFEYVGYTDVDGHVPFKIAIQEVGGRYYMYGGDFWTRGWSITDVTDPSNPEVVNIIEGPANTSTVQMDWAEGRMITPLSRILPGRDFDPTQPYEAGFYIWDTSDPVNPRRLGYWQSEGTHRNWYDGGRYVHAASGIEGYDGNIYVIVDVSDPSNPVEAGRWAFPGQRGGAAEEAEGLNSAHHGPPMPVGNLVYLAYGTHLVILDISDISSPRKIGQLRFSAPFMGGGVPGAGIGVHTVLPIPERGIAIVNSESIAENCEEPLNHASIVDISDPRQPVLLSLLPVPEPPPGSPYADFCEKGGRFGPHNVPQRPDAEAAQEQGDILFLTYFNAGLRAYDISDPRLPREVGYFIPPDPTERYGPLPRTRLVTQTQDVLVDRRGYVYITDRNHGIWILRYTGPKASR